MDWWLLGQFSAAIVGFGALWLWLAPRCELDSAASYLDEHWSPQQPLPPVPRALLRGPDNDVPLAPCDAPTQPAMRAKRAA